MKEKKNYQIYPICQDLNKGIQNVTYNHLNLPTYTTVNNPDVRGSSAYSYSARGEKMRVIHRWENNVYNQPPVLSQVKDYFGNMEYKAGIVYFENGYCASGQYHFYIRDHLGSIRATVTYPRGSVFQSTEYYPYGMPYSESTGQDFQPFKYNGKELDMMNRVNLYDYGFRHYESALARFTTIDPLAEKYPWISPYAYYRFPYSFDEIIVQSGDFNFTSQGNYWYVAPGSVNTGNGWYSIGMYPDRTIFHRGFSNYYPYAK